MDCITEGGDVFLAYCAELRWRAITIHYNGLLESAQGREAQTAYSLRKCPPPAGRAQRLSWVCAQLGVEGTWSSLDPPIYETVLNTDGGAVEWHCLYPRALAEVSVAGSRVFRGLGYVERLELSLRTWDLPVAGLRWGRFLNGSDTLVWIDLRGPFPAQLAYHNGARVRLSHIDERKLVFEDESAVLVFESNQVLRDGPLGGNVLSVVPGAAKIFPAHVLGIRECKWCSRAVLERRSGVPASSGWAIHEVVEWP